MTDGIPDTDIPVRVHRRKSRDATALPHPVAVALAFRPWQHAFWLALFHDAVEDGYLPRWILRIWPALDAITRREGEEYLGGYIPRVAASPAALKVKLADLDHNMRRNGGPRASLMARYVAAHAYLTGEHP